MQAPSAESARTTTDATGIPVWVVVAGATVLGTIAPIVVHYQVHGVVNVHQIAMAFFFWLNAIIAWWEIALFFRIDAIARQYQAYAERYRGREFDRIIDFFCARIPVSQILSTKTWSEVWSSYALFDESYANKKSFGFFIDIGNGFTTLVPSLLIVWGITFHLVPPRALGILGLLVSYQMLYGTLVYFTSYLLNRRYEGHPLRTVALFVGLSNGLWTVFPLWAIGLAIELIYRDSYAVFLG